MYVYTSAYAQKLFGALCSKRKNMVFSLIAFVLLLFLHWCSVSSVADFAIIKNYIFSCENTLLLAVILRLCA